MARYFALIIVLLSVGWVATSPGEWEPWTVFVASMAAFITFDSAAPAVDTPDHRLFRRFLQDLPSSGSIEFLKGWDGQCAYRSTDFGHVKQFRSVWTTADYEFQDKVIETKRRDLLAKIDRFLDCLHANMWASNASDVYAIPEEWRYRQRERFDRVVKELDDLADRVLEAHQTLVRLGRDRLGVTAIE